MEYYFLTTLEDLDFEDAVQRTKEALTHEGFGVLTEIDLRETFKKKLDIDFPNYKILGACNPSLAYQALKAENKIGTMLPCNVIVREHGTGKIEVAAVDPTASMMGVENAALADIANEVRHKLQSVVEHL